MGMAMIESNTMEAPRSLTTSVTNTWRVSSTLTASQIMVICEDVLNAPIRVKHWAQRDEPQVYAEYGTKEISATLFTRPGDRPTTLGVTLVLSRLVDNKLSEEVVNQIIQEASTMVEQAELYG
jgi:hypothetical protein